MACCIVAVCAATPTDVLGEIDLRDARALRADTLAALVVVPETHQVGAASEQLQGEVVVTMLPKVQRMRDGSCSFNKPGFVEGKVGTRFVAAKSVMHIEGASAPATCMATCCRNYPIQRHSAPAQPA